MDELYQQQAISTLSIKGKSSILRRNRCYWLQPLMTAPDDSLILIKFTYHFGLLPPLCYCLHVCVEQIQSLGKNHCFLPMSHRCLHHLRQQLSHFSHWYLLFPLYLLNVCLLQVLSVKRHLQRQNALKLNAILTRILFIPHT